MITLSLQLEGKPCVCVGGGVVAERRLEKLLVAGAQITVISPCVTERIALWHRENKLVWKNKQYEKGDLHGAFLVVAVTDKPEVNARCAEEARAWGGLVNRADYKDDCDFSFPAEVKLGDLQMTLATGKHSPRVTKLLRTHAETYYEPLAEVLPLLGMYRRQVRQLLPTPQDRELFWQEYFTDNDLQLILRGEWIQVEEKLNRAISSLGA